MAEEEANPDDAVLFQIAMVMLCVFSVVGVIGNALVLYVFSNFKQKLTSTVFILTLAGTDFITCLITIPFTIVTEMLNYKLHYDILCWIYQTITTTTVPFSSFVMVAIAVDRYLCICHPFKHAMTLCRARVIVAILCAFAVTLGIICAMMYQIKDMVRIEDIFINYTRGNSSIVYTNKTTITEVIDENMCLPIDHNNPFFQIYQKIYSSFFAICCVIVMILYAIIYRYVLVRRRQRLRVNNKCCGFCAAVPSDVETTEITTLNNEVTTEVRQDEKSDTAFHKNGTNSTEKDTILRPGGVSSEKDTILRPGGVPRAKLEKMKLANIKTLFMLSIVNLVFIVAFLPSWLVALRVLNMNIVVFYMYFLYNVANPVIYAFMNNSFRTQLKQMFGCKK